MKQSIDDLTKLAVFDAREELLAIQSRVSRALIASTQIVYEDDARAFVREIHSLHNTTEYLDWSLRQSLQRLIDGEPTHISEVVAETIQQHPENAA